MNISKAEMGVLENYADNLGIETATLLAIIRKESGGVTGYNIGGKIEPAIRYEGHYFDKLCNANVRARARAAGVSSPTAGTIKNPKSQADRWALVIKAAQFDREAAYMSCSYGVGQVMGSHWKFLGYSSVDKLVSEARSGFLGQVRLMIRFIEKSNLVPALRDHDWSGFARVYNGKNYRKNNYDTDLEKFYRQYGGTNSVSQTRSGYLRLGSVGAGVRDLQAMLKLAGHDLEIDGDFGKTTDAAVRAFQRANKLVPDGIVGPLTNAALTRYRDTAPKDAGQQKLPDIKEVQAGAGLGIGVPAIFVTTKGLLVELAEKLSPYAAMAKVVDFIQITVITLSITALICGVGIAVWGWWKSRQNWTGTIVRTDAIPVEIQRADTPLVLP